MTIETTAPLVLGVATSLALFVGLGLWSALVPLAGAVVAMGEIDAGPLRHPVQHSEGGLVAEVAVRDGQSVAAGDLVLRLEGTVLDQEWQLIEAQIHEAAARSLRLRAERDGTAWPGGTVILDADSGGAMAAQRRLFEARAETLAHQVEQLDQRRAQVAAELAGLVVQEDALTEEVRLIESEIARHRALLTRGLASADRLAQLERDAVQLAGRQGALTARQAELRGQIAEIALQSETVYAARREEAEAQLTELAGRQLELVTRRGMLAERRARLNLRAPLAGRVHALSVAVPGTVLVPGATVAQIIPHTREPAITLRLRPDDIDAVYPGQPAQLHFPAFSDLDLPQGTARVRDISPDALIDENSGTRYFRATLEVTEEGRRALAGRELVPGMAVQAFIATNERTPLAYLIEPVRSQMRYAMREP